MNQILESQQTPHIAPSRASYGMSILRILDKIDRVIMAPHCTKLLSMSKSQIQRGGGGGGHCCLSEGELGFRLPMIRDSKNAVKTKLSILYG